MKKILMSLTLILAMVAGVTLAAANHTSGNHATKRYGKLIDGMGNVTWVDVTNLPYECVEAQETCTTQFENDDPSQPEIIESRVPGQFEL